MPSPVPTRSRSLHWALAGVMVGLSLLLAVAASSNAPVDPLLTPAEATRSASPSSSIATSPSDPARLFAARVTAFTRMQALVLRAFGTEAPTPPGRRTTLVHVAPATTPEGCLTQAVYYEARGEPVAGQAAVAQVVLNRTRAPGRPHSVCGVVFQGAARPGCQFSFACDTRLARARVDGAAWRRAQGVAAAALAGGGARELQTAVNYHADYVRPSWAQRLARTASIGRHIFYAAASTLAPSSETPPPAGE